MYKQAFAAVIAGTWLVGSAQAGIAQWQTQAQATSGNVVADATGYNFAGTGMDYNYGDLDDDGDAASIGAGAAIEFIFNAADSGPSIVLAKFEGWTGENTLLKLEQWNNTGVFGITIPGAGDWTFDSASSVFDTDVHAIFNFRTDGEVELFVDGVSQGVATRGSWIVNGDIAGGDTNYLGGAPNEGITGDIYGVGTYDRALTVQEITALNNAYQVPEPGSLALLGLGGLLIARRRRD